MNLPSAISVLLIPAFILFATCSHSSEPPIQLPDTTSHNFTWSVEHLGDGNSSVLYDVAIINGALAYAVGEVYLRDSLGNWDPNAFNLAKWNGNSWDLLRVQFFTFCGQPYTGSYPTEAILAFSETDIWIAMDGSQVVRWNGQSQTTPMCIPVSVNKLWGENPSTIYAGGYGGGIACYNGATWQKLESQTTLSIQDIWGGANPKTGQTEVLAVASDPYTSYDRKILTIAGTTVSALSDNGINRALSGIWFAPAYGYFVSGGGIWGKSSLGDVQWLNALQGTGLTVQYLDAVRGNGVNDIFATGANGDLLHFNGSTWRNFRDQTSLSSGEYYSVAVKGNLVIAVGEDLSRGVVAVGRRIP
jgi:hypothetical protein